MVLTEHYRAWEEHTDYFLHGRNLVGFSDRAWVDILNILRGLSDGLECDIIDLNSREGTASGVIEIYDEWIYGEMRWTIPSPVRHDYTLVYEIGTDASHQNAHFELVEEVLLPIDRSYIAPIADFILKKFPRSSIMTKRICTFEYYDYAF